MATLVKPPAGRQDQRQHPTAIRDRCRDFPAAATGDRCRRTTKVRDDLGPNDSLPPPVVALRALSPP